MLAARRSAREALSDMAQQNARLVSAYVQKKQELRGVQDDARTSALQWEVSLLADPRLRRALTLQYHRITNMFPSLDLCSGSCRTGRACTD